jgi:hypothetical protein
MEAQPNRVESLVRLQPCELSLVQQSEYIMSVGVDVIVITP